MTKRKESDEKVTAARYEYKKIFMPLECRLTEAELKASAKTLGESLRQVRTLEAQLDTFKSQMKAQLTQQEGIVAEHANRINSEKEFRSVECEVKFDYQEGFKTTTRKDTGEEIRKDKITDEERQTQLADIVVDLRSESER